MIRRYTGGRDDQDGWGASVNRRTRINALTRPHARTDWCRIVNTGPDTAELWLYDEIGYWGTSADRLVEQLRAITASQITVRINSPGGEVFDGLAIYECLRAHPAAVTTRIDGLAASAASFIALAGDRVITARNAMWMIHDASFLAWGDAAALRQQADILDKISNNLADIYAKRCRRGDVADWRALMLAETWFTGIEAVDAGLADETTDPDQMPPDAVPPEMGNTWDLTIFRYAGREAAPAPAPVGGRGWAPAPGVVDAVEPPPTPDVAAPADTAAGAAAPVDTACPTHHTATTEDTWDAGTNEGRLPSPMPLATARRMYGYYDPDRVDNGKIVKAGCKLPHHEVSADGTPGAAVLPGVRNALSRLPQSDIPESEHDAIRAHLHAHLDDAPAEDHADRTGADTWADAVAHLDGDGWDLAVAHLIDDPPPADEFLRLREALL